MRYAALALLVGCTTLLAPLADAQQNTKQPSKITVLPTHEATLNDIQATLGMVPGFLRAFPESALPGAWATMKAIQMNPQSEIPAKNRELIGLAVAAQIPCDYCTYFHTQLAKMHGATEEEIKLTLAEASLTRFMSTFVNGSNIEMAEFRKDVDRASQKLRQQATAGTTRPGMSITDAASARRDIEQVFGFVPAHLTRLPEEVLPGVWSEMKAVKMTPGPIPGKYISLTGLAVSSQMACSECVYAGTSFAEAHGATAREIQEAVLLASSVRHWSTYINGVQTDEAKFKKEVDQMVSALKKKQKNP